MNTRNFAKHLVNLRKLVAALHPGITRIQELQELPDKEHAASTLPRMTKSIHAPQPKGLKK